MGEFSVWLRYPSGHKEKIADSIELVQQDGRIVILYWRQAESRYVLGALQEIDVLNRIITLLPALDGVMPVPPDQFDQ